MFCANAPARSSRAGRCEPHPTHFQTITTLAQIRPEKLKAIKVKASSIAPVPLAPRGRDKKKTRSVTPFPRYSPSNVLVYNWPVHECKKPGGKDSSRVVLRHERPQLEDDSEKEKEKRCVCVCSRAC